MTDGKAGRWPLDIAGDIEDSGTTPSSAAVALVTVTAVEVVPTVGDGEGIRGGTVPMGVTSSCSLVSSEGPGPVSDASTLRSGAGVRVSESG